MTDYTIIPPESTPSENEPSASNLRIIPADTTAIDLYAEDAKEAFARCERLTQYRSMLQEFLREISRVGLIGEKRNSAIGFLVATSRNLENPTSLAFRGQSGSGKSNLADTVLKFIPVGDVYQSTTLSNTSLVYSPEDFRHRIIVVPELAGLGSEDNEGLYNIREFLTRNKISKTATQDAIKGGGRVAPRVEKEGPISLITTTTHLNILEDLNTRLIVVNVDESEEHIRLVAKRSRRAKKVQVSKEWLYLQQWLDLKRQINGAFMVDIPYIEAMVDLMPPAVFKQSRANRDIDHVIGLIEAHTILHHINRDMTSNGEYRATLDDYTVVRQLMNDVLGETLHLTVPDGIRKIVDAVEKLAPNPAMSVNALQLANFVALDPKTVKRFASTAVRLGYLKGETDYRTKKLYLSRDSTCIDLPRYLHVLPQSEVLRRFFT